jgi:RNA 3'-terminal phosphate cyclase (ATP)
LIEIDGSLGEGGGSIIRISSALSAITSQPIHISNIRANRSKTGFAAQHLNAVISASQISQAISKGLVIGSPDLKFHPKKLIGGKFSLDVKTAGSVGLILQTFMIIAPFASKKSTIDIMGGTDVRGAPSIEYIKHVTLPILQKMGYNAKINLIKRGHYPRGGGMVTATIYPLKKIKPLNLLKSEIDSIKGISHATNLPRHVAERQALAAEKIFKNNGFEVDIEIEHSSSNMGMGSGIVLWARGNTRIGSSELGKPSKSAEKVGMHAAENLIATIKTGSALDEHMGDQIVPYMALSRNSQIGLSKLTMHTLTNLHIVKKFIDKKFQITPKSVDNRVGIDLNKLKLKNKDLKFKNPVIISCD